MKSQGFFSGFVMGLVVITGCASVTYRYYGLSLPDSCYSQGILLGAPGSGGWPNLPLSQCQPDPQPSGVKGKCWIETTEDWIKKDQDLKLCQQQLIDCQKGTPPS